MAIPTRSLSRVGLTADDSRRSGLARTAGPAGSRMVGREAAARRAAALSCPHVLWLISGPPPAEVAERAGTFRGEAGLPPSSIARAAFRAGSGKTGRTWVIVGTVAPVGRLRRRWGADPQVEDVVAGEDVSHLHSGG